jgi:hypothetical protein
MIDLKIFYKKNKIKILIRNPSINIIKKMKKLFDYIYSEYEFNELILVKNDFRHLGFENSRILRLIKKIINIKI